MNFLGDFHFIRPAWLLLLPVAIGIWWRVRQSQDPLRGWRELMDHELLNAMTVGGTVNSSQHHRVSTATWYRWGLLVAWLLSIVALSGPTWRAEPSPFADDPVPVMIVLRAGDTMDLSDLSPSRMERARLKVADFAALRKGQPLGLVTYAGSSHLVLPPTRDTSVVATMAAEISPAIMPKPGDDLADALRTAARALGDTGGSIVVMTDTVLDQNKMSFDRFRSASSLPVYFLAIARDDTPEFDAIEQAAAELHSHVTLLTPDSQDVRSLVRSTAKAPLAVDVGGDGTRWSEAGWWLVPLLALFSLLSFRRVCSKTPEPTT